jgi:peptidoglycan/LPS O-acetylase OafA/YrhL
MEKMKQVNFPALTGVRIVAAFMVYIHHFNPFSTHFFGKSVHYFFDGFHVGVTLFFVLSGFLIAHRYYESSDFNFKYYLQKRFARIYPMYFILTTLTFVLGYYFTISHGGFGTYFLNITFLRGFFDDFKFSGIPQGWTLTIEETFYFLAPCFFLLVKRNKWMLLLLPICFILIGVFLVELFKNSDFHGLMNNLNFMLGYTFFGRVFEFFSGIVLALILKKNTNFKFKHFTIIGIFGIVCSIYILSILEQCPLTDLLIFQQSLVNNLLLPVMGIVPFFYGLINEKTILHKLFSSDFFILLGKSSYVFYLIHIGFFRTFVLSFSTNYIFVFLSLNVIAIMLYLYVEKPLNRFFRKISL